jgi:NAD(P)-dependent dehydrogenase (short-subunit alcohol dehydrogenase family)
MASIFVTGSSDGIGRETAATLLAMGHRVVLHARNEARAAEVRDAAPGAAAVLVGDLASLEETTALAETARGHGPFDVVVHNAGVGGGQASREVTLDGLERIFQVNALAPYVLTALMDRPSRLVYLTSGLQENGHLDLTDLQHERRPWNGMQVYSDSKLCDVVLALAVARRWPGTLCNAVDPGWIKTRMGGPQAPDPLHLGAETQVWLATSDEAAATVTGRYFKRRRELEPNPQATDVALQEAFLGVCRSLSGVELP